MAFQETNNLVDTMVETQKKVLDSVVENTKKFTNGSPITETIEKGTDWFKNWLDTQKTTFSKMTEAASSANGSEKSNATNKAGEFFEQWMAMQTNFAKQMWEAAQDAGKNFTNTTSNPFANVNPFMTNNPFANWQNNFTNMQNPFNTWMSNMQNANPFNNDTFKKAGENMNNMFTEYYTLLNKSFGEWNKGFQNTTVEEAYKNMVSTGEGFMKFAEMWMPMFKSIQDKTFNMDAYKQYMKPELYKEFMDKFFGFMPESSRQQMQHMTTLMTDNMKQMGQTSMNGYNQMRDMMAKMGNGAEMFQNMQNTYNQFYSMMNEAASPFAKMATPNQFTKAAAEWNDLMNRIAQYNMKNAELQYMIYNQGTKVMDALAENVAKKVQEGTEVTSMLALYQEWLNISDKVYVSLFESNEYSKLMGEVSGMQNRLRQDIDGQVEKMMKDIPVATRSEMNEMYKTVYELKKQVRQLEKMLDLDGETKTEEAKAEKTTKGSKK